MKIGMTGLQSSGRTTVFNALTRGHADTGPVAGRDGNIGVARVPDERLGVVANIIGSRTSVQAEVTYVDLPSSRTGDDDLFSGENATQATAGGRVAGGREIVQGRFGAAPRGVGGLAPRPGEDHVRPELRGHRSDRTPDRTDQRRNQGHAGGRAGERDCR